MRTYDLNLHYFISDVEKHKEIKDKFPQFWKDDYEDGGKNLYESELLKKNINRLNIVNLKHEYHKITSLKNGVKLSGNLKQSLQNDLTTIVYNFVDMLSHSKTEMEMIKELAPNDKAYRSLTNSWFINSPLFEIIKNASSLGFKLVITTDHGTINVKNPTKIIGDRNTSQNLRYKTGRSLTTNEKDNLVFKNPHDILLPKTSMSTASKIQSWLGTTRVPCAGRNAFASLDKSARISASGSPSSAEASSSVSEGGSAPPTGGTLK